MFGRCRRRRRLQILRWVGLLAVCFVNNHPPLQIKRDQIRPKLSSCSHSVPRHLCVKCQSPGRVPRIRATKRPKISECRSCNAILGHCPVAELHFRNVDFKLKKGKTRFLFSVDTCQYDSQPAQTALVFMASLKSQNRRCNEELRLWFPSGKWQPILFGKWGVKNCFHFGNDHKLIFSTVQW